MRVTESYGASLGNSQVLSASRLTGESASRDAQGARRTSSAFVVIRETCRRLTSAGQVAGRVAQPGANQLLTEGGELYAQDPCRESALIVWLRRRLRVCVGRVVDQHHPAMCAA